LQFVIKQREKFNILLIEAVNERRGGIVNATNAIIQLILATDLISHLMKRNF